MYTVYHFYLSEFCIVCLAVIPQGRLSAIDNRICSILGGAIIRLIWDWTVKLLKIF